VVLGRRKKRGREKREIEAPCEKKEEKKRKKGLADFTLRALLSGTPHL